MSHLDGCYVNCGRARKSECGAKDDRLKSERRRRRKGEI